MGAVDRDCAIIAQSLRLWALGIEDAKPLNAWQTTRVVTDSHSRTVFSYGRHFPLATVYPRGRNRGLIVLNGDAWRGNNSRTNAHQSATQTAAQDICREAPGWQAIIIPMSALDGAGIDAASIKPLDIRPDRRDSFTHTAILPSGTFGAAPDRGTVPNPRAYDWQRNRVADQPLDIAAPDAIERRRVTLTVESAGAGIDRAGIAASVTREATVTRRTVWREGSYGRNGWQENELDQPRFEYSVSGAVGASASAQYPTHVSASLASGSKPGAGAAIKLDWSSSRHWLGDSLFTADRVSESREACHSADPTAPDDKWCEQCGGSLRREGFERRTVRRRYRWVSSFDYNELAPLYFLAALPRASRAQTVAMAIEDLAPRAVHAALARGLAVLRQGDIFFIPTALTDADMANRNARRARLTMHTRGAKPRKGELGYVPPLDAAARRRMAAWRRDRWRELMALDRLHNAAPVTDAGARNRFAKLRAAHAATLAKHNASLRSAIMGADRMTNRHAYRSHGASGLTPSQSRRAIASAVTDARRTLDYARRHGGTDSHGAATVAHARDWYRMHNANRAIELWRQAGTDAQMRFAPASVIGSGAWQAAQDARRDALAIYGTAHTATEVAVTASGTYARGTVRHVPSVARERRDADHRPLTLDADRWYLAVRNTVPRMRDAAAMPNRRRW